MADCAGADTCSYVFDPDDPVGAIKCQLEPATLDADGVWHCPRVPNDDHEECLFHRSPDERPSDVDVSEALLDELDRVADLSPRRARERRRQFVGAVFPELCLDAAVVDADDNYPLDLRHAEVGTLSCVDATVSHDLLLDGARVTEALVVEGDLGTLRLRGGDCTGATVDLSGSRFDAVTVTDTMVAMLDVSDIRADCGTFDGVTAEAIAAGDAQFTTLECNDLTCGTAEFGFVDVRKANFNGFKADRASFYFADIDEADFRRATFDHAVFKHVTFDGGYFNEVEIEVGNFISARIDRAHFGRGTIGEGSFHDARFDSLASFGDAHVGWCNFQNAAVATGSFDGATLEQASFRGTTFESVTFEDVDPAGTLVLADVTVEDDLVVEPTTERPPGDAYVSLRRSDLASATLAQPATGRAVYDLEDATLGDVQFRGTSDDADLLDYIRFLHTRFDAFDFRDDDDLDPVTSEFVIHDLAVDAEVLDTLVVYGKTLFARRLDDDPARDPPSPSETGVTANRSQPRRGDDGYEHLRAACAEAVADRTTASDGRFVETTFSPAALETTYLRAKNGANRTNDNRSASAFFQEEMRQRRFRYWERLDAAVRSTEDQPLWERARTIRRDGVRWLSNLLLEGAAGYGEKPSYVVFASLVTVVVYGVGYFAFYPHVFDRVGQYLLLSLGSFVSFIIGPTSQVNNSAVGFVSQVEGFIGAFLIALFVFTLTRSIHR